MNWNYFISHASEDKPLLVNPLAHYLRTSGFLVWYDEFTLKVGDSLLESISAGLNSSEYGVIILSPSFFAKKWPRQELAGFVALETSNRKKLLPVWHKIGVDEVASFSPILADRKAADTRRGLQHVAEQLVAATYPDRVKELPLSSATKTEESEAAEARNTLRELLQGTPSTDDIYLYLSGYPILLESVLGYCPRIIPGFKLPGPFRCDFAELAPHGVTGPIEVLFVILGSVTYDHELLREWITQTKRELGPSIPLERHPANDYLGAPYFGEYPTMTGLAAAIQDHVRSDNIHWKRPGTWSFRFMLLAGRRGHVPLEERNALMSSSGLRIDIASYDRLLDDRKSIYG
jgi:hypothetical protein